MSGPEVGADPGSPQSSTSTVNETDPETPVCVAIPMNCACFPLGLAGQAALESVITNVVTVVALMRTPAPWSLYSRFPLGAQHATEKPNVACPPTLVGLEALVMRSVANSSTASRIVLLLEDSILPPPVALPGVFGAAGHGGPGGLVRNGMKSTLFCGATTASPVPPGLPAFVGPVELPHQLFSAFSFGVSGYAPAETSRPAIEFPLMQLK